MNIKDHLNCATSEVSQKFVEDAIESTGHATAEKSGWLDTVEVKSYEEYRMLHLKEFLKGL